MVLQDYFVDYLGPTLLFIVLVVILVLFCLEPAGTLDWSVSGSDLDLGGRGVYNYEEMILPRKGPLGSRHLIVIVNPFSGNKRAPTIWQSVSHLFDEAHIYVTMVETTEKNHAFRIAQSINPHDCDGIVCVGGDGILHEVVNGLLNRVDAGLARHIPLGIIPAGGGNGVAYTLGAGDTVRAAQIIIGGLTHALDVSAVRAVDRLPLQPATSVSASYVPKRAIYSVLFVGWGLMSEMERLQDRLRMLGQLKVVVAAVLSIFGKFSFAVYDSTLVFIPVAHERIPCTRCARPCAGCDDTPRQDKGKRAAADPDAWAVVEGASAHTNALTNGGSGGLLLLSAANCQYAARDFGIAPFAHLADGCLDIVTVHNCSRLRLIALLNLLQRGQHLGTREVHYEKTRELFLEIRNRNIPLNIDGELFDVDQVGDRLHVEVLRGHCSVFCSPDPPPPQ